jgi:hypothetical protein
VALPVLFHTSKLRKIHDYEQLFALVTETPTIRTQYMRRLVLDLRCVVEDDSDDDPDDESFSDEEFQDLIRQAKEYVFPRIYSLSWITPSDWAMAIPPEISYFLPSILSLVPNLTELRLSSTFETLADLEQFICAIGTGLKVLKLRNLCLMEHPASYHVPAAAPYDISKLEEFSVKNLHSCPCLPIRLLKASRSGVPSLKQVAVLGPQQALSSSGIEELFTMCSPGLQDIYLDIPFRNLGELLFRHKLFCQKFII